MSKQSSIGELTSGSQLKKHSLQNTSINLLESEHPHGEQAVIEETVK